MKNLIYLLILCLSSCVIAQNNPKQVKTQQELKLLERGKDLSNYYHDVLNAKLPKNGLVLILQNKTCGSVCQIGTIDEILPIVKRSKLDKTFIIAQEDDNLTDRIKNMLLATVFIDKKRELADYGLDYGVDLCCVIKNGALKQCFDLADLTFETLKTF